jgi:shikimate dehydrogenase
MKTSYSYYAVAGNPISHSLSPYIFNTLFQDSGTSAYYTRLLSMSADDALETAKLFGIKGMNVTAPLKEELFRKVGGADDNAKEIGAINVVTYMAGMPFGYNTDCRGVIATFEDLNIDLYKRDVLILGAGGAARAAVKGLTEYTKSIRVLNRTVEKAEKLAEEYGILYDRLDKYQDYIGSVDIIISTLPDSVDLDLKGVDKFAIFVDANYHKPNNVRHANYVSGEHWLLNQALLTYDMFTWYTPEKQDMIQAMHQPRKEFSNIILVGFSGAGKSYIGRKLADALGMDFLDTDEEIEKYRGMSVNEIFEKLSEYEFRNNELEILKRMEGCRNTVIATGGGAVEFESTRKQMQKNGFVVYMFSPYDVSLKRADSTNRPKLRESEDEIFKLYEKRKKLYYITSDLMINSNHPADRIVDTLANDIKRTISNK